MIDMVTYTNKTGEDEWEATIKVKGDMKSIDAVTKMLNSLVFLLRGDAPSVIEIDVEERPLSMGEKFG